LVPTSAPTFVPDCGGVVAELALAYRDKEAGYFGGVRMDILPLLPAASHTARVLEIGCGSGQTLEFLKETGRCAWAAGVELVHDVAASARTRADVVFEGNIEAIELPIPPASLDLILCLDVLEHLIDPWGVIHKLDALLKPGGAIIGSIPNVRHIDVILPLILSGRWRYTDSGLLDRTHLRFFTRQSAIALMECSGLRVDAIESTGLVPGSKRCLFNALTLSLFKSFFEVQYLIRARKVAG
jgi:SAM-dependent methyltransferase